MSWKWGTEQIRTIKGGLFKLRKRVFQGQGICIRKLTIHENPVGDTIIRRKACMLFQHVHRRYDRKKAFVPMLTVNMYYRTWV
jgi:hypothetical protein